MSRLLLRRHDGKADFELSFLLSIPAAVGAALLAVLEGGAWLAPPVALALGVNALVGYATLDGPVRLAGRVASWAVCMVLDGLAVVGGALTFVV